MKRQILISAVLIFVFAYGCLPQSMEPGRTELADKTTVQIQVWGEVVNGLRAALEFIPEKKSYSLGEEIGIRVHIQNMSDKVIPVAIVKGRTFPGYPIIEDIKESKIIVTPLKMWDGRRSVDRRLLNPGETVVFEAERGFAIYSEREKSFNDFKDSESFYELKPGEYLMRYKLNLSQSFESDDWQGTLETGNRKLVIIKAE
jgi:hypothetical protein